MRTFQVERGRTNIRGEKRIGSIAVKCKISTQKIANPILTFLHGTYNIVCDWRVPFHL